MTVMPEWLADCSTRARLMRPGNRGQQEYGGESSIEPVVRVKRRSAMKKKYYFQLYVNETTTNANDDTFPLLKCYTS